jgi:hypothetical protein
MPYQGLIAELGSATSPRSPAAGLRSCATRGWRSASYRRAPEARIPLRSGMRGSGKRSPRRRRADRRRPTPTSRSSFAPHRHGPAAHRGAGLLRAASGPPARRGSKPTLTRPSHRQPTPGFAHAKMASSRPEMMLGTTPDKALLLLILAGAQTLPKNPLHYREERAASERRNRGSRSHRGPGCRRALP